MTNALHFNIRFEDLTDAKQEAIIDALTPALQAAAEVEGKELLARPWNNPKPQTWQEAYVRTYTIDYDLWKDYEAGKDPTRDPDFVWETRQEEYVRHMARQKAIAEFSKTEIEVAL
jgi:hypothetical protein